MLQVAVVLDEQLHGCPRLGTQINGIVHLSQSVFDVLRRLLVLDVDDAAVNHRLPFLRVITILLVEVLIDRTAAIGILHGFLFKTVIFSFDVCRIHIFLTDQQSKAIRLNRRHQMMDGVHANGGGG